MICFLDSLKIILFTRFQNLFACVFDKSKGSKLNYPFCVVQVVSLIIQIIVPPNFIFGLTIHPDSKLLHHLFI